MAGAGDHRQLRVLVDIGHDTLYIAVLARSGVQGRRGDRLVLRTTLPLQDETMPVRACLEAAAAALQKAADGL
jgi:hypothetical protein